MSAAVQPISTRDFYVSPAYAHVPHEWRAAGSCDVSMAHFEQPAGDYPVPPLAEFRLQLMLSDVRHATVDHGGRFTCKPRVGQMTVSPPQTALRYEVAGDLRGMSAVLPLRLVEEIASEAGLSASCTLALLHAQMFQDEAVAALTKRLWHEAAQGSPNGGLFADEAWRTVVRLLLRRAGADSTLASPPLAASAADWRLRRAIEVLETQLTDDIGLIELAALVDLTPQRLTALFRAGLGEPPHRYRTRRRIERACELLADPRQSVTEIALACGFASSQHFATVFRRRMGVTPTEYRRERVG